MNKIMKNKNLMKQNRMYLKIIMLKKIHKKYK